MIFEARIPEYDGEDEDSWVSVEAYDAAGAAEEYVEDRDKESGEAPSDGVDVQVRDRDGIIKTYQVSSWLSVNYSATPKRLK
jgi:hypothetical protein